MRHSCAADVGVALGAVGVLRNAVPGAGLVAALAEHDGAVGVGELDDVVVEDFAVVLAGADLAAALALGLDGVGRSLTQLMTSRLWMCCSTMWSPQSQVK